MSPLNLQPPFSPTIPQHLNPHAYPTKHVKHVRVFLSMCITHKAISTSLAAAVAAAAALASVAVVDVAAAVAAEVATAAEVALGTTAAVAIAFTSSDLTRFRLRYLNFF